MKQTEYSKQMEQAKRQRLADEAREKRNAQKLMSYRNNKQKLLKLIFILVGLLFLSYFNKGSFPDFKKIHPDLFRQPLQTDTGKKDVTLNYKGVQYLIHPVKDYEISGLVVSHNNPFGFGDIYHDEKSFDTKDLCLIWGNNLMNNDFQKVKYWNVSWTCNIRFPLDIKFQLNELSNNHLITGKSEVRDKIAKIKVGDQVKIKGVLANYTNLTSESSWRNSSLSRDDAGNGACEVIFVDSLEVIKKGTPIWYFLFMISKWGLLFCVVIFVFIFTKMSKLEANQN